MNRSSERSWVWHSTGASRAAEHVSLLAVVETLFFVVVYWVLVFYMGMTWHHWIILISAPLVLLRSKESVDLGAKWFNHYLQNSIPIKLASIKGIGMCILVALLAGIISWLFTYSANNTTTSTSHAIIGYGVVGWFALHGGLAGAVAVAGESARVKALVVTFLISCTIATAVITFNVGLFTIPAVIAGVCFAAMGVFIASVGRGIVSGPVFYTGGELGALMPGIYAGIYVNAIFTRFVATSLHIFAGMQQLSRNWRFLVLCSDCYHPPELVPASKFNFGSFSADFFRRSEVGLYHRFVGHLSHVVSALLWYLPVLVWRWAIKSTAWFYIPLLFVQRGWLRLKEEELHIWAQSYSRKVINWIWLMFGGLSLAFLAVGLLSFEKWYALRQATAEAGAPMTFVGVVMSLNWTEVLTQPWMWFYIPSYVLTIWIFFALDSIAEEVRAGSPPETRRAEMVRLQWAANTRAALTNIGLIVALWYFLTAVDVWEQLRDFFARTF